MKIIIAGDGKVGYTLSEILSHEGHDITVIDNRKDVLDKTLESLDVITISGNAASVSVLESAGARDADLFIAATSTDELNMLCCLIAKKMGVKNTIARIRNPEYGAQLGMLEEEMGLSMAVNPELASATEIARVMRFPHAISVSVFADDRVYMVEYKVQYNNPLAGQTVAAMHRDYAADVLICAVKRGAEVFIPNGDFVIRSGDNIFIAGGRESIRRCIAALGYQERKVKTAMLVGGGLITRYVSYLLLEEGVKIKIIEKNQAKCEQLCETIPKALVIHGDGTERELLDAEDMDKADAFLALTNMDEENLVISMYAVYKGVSKVITKINRIGYTEVIQQTGIDRVISPKNIGANHIVRFVRGMQKAKGSNIKTLYRIHSSAEIVEFEATASAKHLGEPLSQIPLKKNVLVTAIVRGDSVLIPKGSDSFREGDRVIIATAMTRLTDLNQIYQ